MHTAVKAFRNCYTFEGLSYTFIAILLDSKKTCSILWSVWDFFGFPEKRRPNKCCSGEVNLFFYIYIVSLICEKVNLSWKIAVQNVGCVFAYFCGGHKNNFRLQFRNSFNIY